MPRPQIFGFHYPPVWMGSFFLYGLQVDILDSRDRFRQASLAYVRQLQEDQVLATTEAVDMPSCGMSTETIYDQ